MLEYWDGSSEYEDEEDSEYAQYLYAKLNKEVQGNDYSGSITDTAEVVVDNVKNKIYVNTRNTPRIYTSIVSAPSKQGDILIYNQQTYISVFDGTSYSWQLLSPIAKFG